MPRLVCCFCLGATLLVTPAVLAQELVLDDFEHIAGCSPAFSEAVTVVIKLTAASRAVERTRMSGFTAAKVTSNDLPSRAVISY